MNIDNILYSGFRFSEDENLLKFKFKVLNSILIITIFFTVLLALLSDLGINDIGRVQTMTNYISSVVCIAGMLYLRLSKDNFFLSVIFLLTIIFLSFIIALIYVPEDAFRIIWFYITTYIAFILLGGFSGKVVTALSIVTILITNYFVDLQFSQLTLVTSLIGLFIFSTLSQINTNMIAAYENSLHEKNIILQQQARTDSLTGIMNRRYFDEVSSQYFETAQKYNKNISLLTIDLDHFKNINDTYGHAIGDEILISFAENIKKKFSESDIFARIGGEEFGALLFDTDIEIAKEIAENIRLEVEKFPYVGKGEKIAVTTSIGVTQNLASDEKFSSICIRSDEALYKAKNEGRNRVCVLL